ncbi:MAG: hypothetical protein AMJ78_07855 [Omnitrophica WOR_2 bacterium SM23_29]|nr:MAG: hypothetical protein AMJ78_07855 [Omnitrophica WOR_2 bacterium SM23_29]
MSLGSVKKVKKLCYFISLWVFLLSCVPNLNAMPVESKEVTLNRNADIETISKFLAQDIVKSKLSKMGLTEAQVSERISRLSDAQLRSLAMRIDSVKSGGDASTIIIVLLILSLVVIAILYFTDQTIKLEPKHKR